MIIALRVDKIQQGDSSWFPLTIENVGDPRITQDIIRGSDSIVSETVRTCKLLTRDLETRRC